MVDVDLYLELKLLHNLYYKEGEEYYLLLQQSSLIFLVEMDFTL